MINPEPCLHPHLPTPACRPTPAHSPTARQRNGPGPDGIRNTYCREDQLLDALPRLLRDNGVPSNDTGDHQPDADNTEQLIDLLPAHNLVITYGDSGTQLTEPIANTQPAIAR